MFFDEISGQIKQECDRLGWTEFQCKSWLFECCGKRSRLLLSDDELVDCLSKLKSYDTVECYVLYASAI